MKTRFSLQEIIEVMAENNGLCLGCGEANGPVEPDARKVQCECCGEHLVYGFEELLLMGVTS
jgi:hypothetical protein